MTTTEMTLIIASLALVLTVIGAVWKFGQQIGALTSAMQANTAATAALGERVRQLERESRHAK